MRPMMLGVLLVLAALPAFGQESSSSEGPMVIHDTHRKFPHVQVCSPGTIGDINVDCSENWAGYAVTGSSFTFAKGSWKVPSVNCNTDGGLDSWTAFWVGISSTIEEKTGTIEQIGTETWCHNTNPYYYAVYEFYPATAQSINGFPIHPGDVISASVQYNADSSKFTLTITNETTGNSAPPITKILHRERAAAEWITEAAQCPLGDFDKVKLGKDYTNVIYTNYATDLSTSGPIGDFGNHIHEIIMRDACTPPGNDLAVPSLLTTDGTSFDVVWKRGQ